MRLNPDLRGSPVLPTRLCSHSSCSVLPTRRRRDPARRLGSTEESDLHLHLSREASDPAAHQDETRFIHWMAAICAVLRWALHIAMLSAERSCRHTRPCTAPPIAPKPAQVLAPAMLTARELSQAPKPCSSSLQTAAMSGGGTRGAQTVEWSHCCPAARVLPPNARTGCQSIAATAPGSFPASEKGGMSTCGSTRLILAKGIHTAKVSQASGKRAERVPLVFECIAVSPDSVVRA